MLGTVEKRRAARIYKSYFVSLILNGLDSDEVLYCKGRTRDVSKTGAYILNSIDVSVNMPGTIEWILPTDPGYKVTGFVSRIDEDGFGFMFDKNQDWVALAGF